MSDIPLDLHHALDVATSAVEAAAQVELAYFDSGIDVIKKEDRSPVTVADHEGEAAIAEVLKDAFPEHAFLGEESGARGGTHDFRWVVDPLDGTRGFARGGRFWGPMLALLYRDRPVVGVMALPVTGETYAAAIGLGATKNGKPLRVSLAAELEESTLSLGEIKHLLSPTRRHGVTRLIARAASTRCYGDLASCVMLLEGRADVWLEAGVKVWDLAPLQILVEEAGGRFSDFEGNVTVHAGHAVATNGHLHDLVLSVLGEEPRER